MSKAGQWPRENQKKKSESSPGRKPELRSGSRKTRKPFQESVNNNTGRAHGRQHRRRKERDENVSVRNQDKGGEMIE